MPETTGIAQEQAKNMQLGKVAVLMGGHSAEREISLISGKAVLEALRSAGVDAHAFDPAETPVWRLKEEGFQRAFIALHGRFGEDGTVQGALQVLGIPYTGSGVMASALAMDKWRTKMVWQAAGVPTPKFRMLTPGMDFAAVIDELGLPLIVKPAREGSSIGVSKVENAAQFRTAFDAAYKLDPLVIAEEFVAGREGTAAVLGDQALPLVYIEPLAVAYDYQNKYFTDKVRYHCPAGFAPEVTEAIQADAVKAFRALGCRGWGRADFIVREDGSYTFLEMNTAPGMTSHSLVPMAANSIGIDFPALCRRILEMASLD
ncbi:D-alanine--D-alanine ligase [Uliginosibacterium gangwonense]|uniref:D-alanine--D-alanine ligase n=1 Tax=Uliginosibacterium gangwonense TaxID=392736 RepID=UPI00037A4272|nr:D-alanine--D-alanine ligase [Uliginosibacterium gangwonense]